MIFYIISLFPEVFEEYLNSSILGRGIKKNNIEIVHIQLRDFAENKHHKVDGKPYGGGAGMLLQCSCLDRAITSVYKDNSKLIFLSPGGKTLNQRKIYRLTQEKEIILVCGYYEGFDERIYSLYKKHEKISIGDYILSNGGLGALIILDAVIRISDHVLSNKNSIMEESFSDGLLEYSQYTKPREYKGHKVPYVLLNGNHKKIQDFRRQSSIKNTLENRYQLLFKKKLSLEELETLSRTINHEFDYEVNN